MEISFNLDYSGFSFVQVRDIETFRYRLLFQKFCNEADVQR